MRGLCVVYVRLGRTSVNKNTTSLERVLYLCLALDWRCSDVFLPFTFTRRKTLTFFNMQKFCAEVDAQYKWITFIQLYKIINEFWRTPFKRITTHYPKFFIVCALGVRDGMCDCMLRIISMCSKHETSNQCCLNVGLPSTTLVQH